MSEMVRKQIYISKRQDLLLKRLARARGISEAAIIRHAIDQEAINASAPLALTDEESWQKMVNFMRSMRSEATVLQQPYRWNREELYEDRLGRHAVQDSPEDGAKNTPDPKAGE